MGQHRKRIFDAMYKLGNVRMNVAQIAATAGLSEVVTAGELLELHNLGQINGRHVGDLYIPPAQKLKSKSLFADLEIVRRPKRQRSMRSTAE